VLAVYRTVQYRSPSFIIILGTGVLNCLITGMALWSRRNYTQRSGRLELS